MEKITRRLLLLVVLSLQVNISSYGHERDNSSYLDSDWVLDLHTNFTAVDFDNALSTRNDSILKDNLQSSGVTPAGTHETEVKERKESSMLRSSMPSPNEITSESAFYGRKDTFTETTLHMLSNLSTIDTSPPADSPDLPKSTSLLMDIPRLPKDPAFHVFVGENCTKQFFTYGLKSPMAECSLPALFRSYSRAEDVSKFKSLTLTSADMEIRDSKEENSLEAKYVVNGSITFSSTDQFHISSIVSRRRFGWSSRIHTYCIQLRIPPLTTFELRADNVKMWTKIYATVSIKLNNQKVKLIELVRGQVLRSTKSDEELCVKTNINTFFYVGIRQTFTLVFEAQPLCVRNRLDVVCPTKSRIGYIQTPNWDGERPYDPNMNTCVTVVSPDKRVVMISFVMLELEACPSCVCDSIQIYLTSACQGPPVYKLCQREHVFPSTHLTEVMSVRFESNYMREQGGFRLLYSFLTTSDPPVQLWNGRWDCSGDDRDFMVQHFICSSEAFCQNAEDRLTGECPPADLCGENSVLIDDQCYRFIQPSTMITWEDALGICEANQGYLASLNTEQEWRNVVEFWRNELKSGYLMVGLRFDFTPNQYSSMWQWADGTVAYYVSIHKNTTFYPPYCTAFYRKEDHLDIISCQSDLTATYICELRTHSDQDLERNHDLQIVLPVPSRSASAISGMADCPNVHVQDLKQKEHIDRPPALASGYGSTVLTDSPSTGATHLFLQCDKLSCYTRKMRNTERCLRGKPFLAETMFECRNKVQKVHYTLVCDRHHDCTDRSDESFCVFPVCVRGQFQCLRTRQCIPRDFRCDGIEQCDDKSDESMCEFFMNSNTVLPPAIINFIGKGNFTVTALNASHPGPVCPETHFQCPGDGYCLPVYVRCNNVSDCPEGADEAECSSYICPGFYHCRDSQNCVHADHLCDGEFQCPFYDDELMCNMTCPSNCACLGFAFDCSRKFAADLHPQLRYLKADNTGMNLQDVASNILLIYISLKHCNIKEIGDVDLPNVRSLDLSYNAITSFTKKQLKTMKSLRSLSLAFNSLLSLNYFDYMNVTFPFLRFLDMSGVSTHQITNTSFLPFPNVERLNLSGNKVHKVWEPGFSALRVLEVLDFSECPVNEFYVDMFQSLSSIQTIYAPRFQMCCPSILPEDFDPDNCHAPSNEVSSCAALLRADIFRVFLVIYAFLALVGNSVSFVYRVFGKGTTTNLGFDIFVTHLCVADFLMGVYLAIVGIADRIYYGTYEWNDSQWKQSIACQMAGFLSLLSSEVSAYLICFITLERFLLIRFPYKNLRFTTKSARITCIIGWGLGVLLATIPLFPFSPQWDFYSQTGICIPLPVTREVFPGSDYSFFVMIVFNFILFLLIAVGQLLIYRSVHSQSLTVKRSKKKAKDMAIARRLVAVAMSDFLCWFPIGVLGLLARSGVPVPGDVNVALAIFVLPFNSALNPFLYTFHVMLERHQIARAQSRLEKRGNMTSTNCPTSARRDQLQLHGSSSLATADRPVMSTGSTGGYIAEEAWQVIENWLEEGLMTPDFLQLRLAKMANQGNSLTVSQDRAVS